MRSRKERKKHLMAEAERLVDELLAWEEEAEEPTLADIEDEVLVLRKRLGIELAESVISGQASKQPVDAPNCPRCGCKMRYKGQKDKGVESRLGFLQTERGYYRCPSCGEGIFPPGPATEGKGS